MLNFQDTKVFRRRNLGIVDQMERPHRDLCRVQSGVRDRAMVLRRLGLRRHRYRSDALFNAYRRRVDHSEGESLSSGLSSSSMSHDGTGQPVVDRDKSHESGYEIQRQNSENEQIRTLLDRQREQILADCQALENTNSRLITTEEVNKN